MALTEAEELELLELEALEAEETQKQPSLLQKTGEIAKKGAIMGAKALPLAGGIAGGIIASPGIITTPAGAALGAAGGEALKQLSLRALGEPTPKTSLEAAKDIGIAGLKEGAIGAATGGIGRLLAKPAVKLGKLVTTPSLQKIGKSIEDIGKAKGISLADEIEKAPRTRKAIIQWAKTFKNIDKKAEHIQDPKLLNMVREETGNILDFLKVAEKGAQPKKMVAKKTVATLAKIKEKATKQLTKEVPELAEPFKQYGIAKTRKEILSQLGEAIPGFIKKPVKSASTLIKYLAK